MLRKTLPGLLLLCGVFSAKAQLVISSDTTLCETAPVTLEVISAPSYGTTSYTFVEGADYAPEAYAGTTISLSDDSYGGPYSIGFTFCFLGNEYTQFYTGSNGWLSFGAPEHSLLLLLLLPFQALQELFRRIVSWDPGQTGIPGCAQAVSSTRPLVLHPTASWC